VYREPTLEEERRLGEPVVPAEQFDMPELKLLQPNVVVDVAVSNVRLKNQERKGMDFITPHY
jgi:hypothetical protein